MRRQISLNVVTSGTAKDVHDAFSRLCSYTSLMISVARMWVFLTHKLSLLLEVSLELLIAGKM
jgi:hypothetical protein